MNVEQALQLLSGATGQLKLTREDHIKIQLAFDVLNAQNDAFKAMVAEKNAAKTAAKTEEEKKPLDTAEKALA